MCEQVHRQHHGYLHVHQVLASNSIIQATTKRKPVAVRERPTLIQSTLADCGHKNQWRCSMTAATGGAQSVAMGAASVLEEMCVLHRS